MQNNKNNDLEMQFKKNHPKLYILYTLFTCVLILAPCIAAPIIRANIFGSNSNPYWGASGVIGGIVFGVGLFNIMASIFKRGWRPVIMLLLLLIGGLMMTGAFVFP